MPPGQANNSKHSELRQCISRNHPDSWLKALKHMVTVATAQAFQFANVASNNLPHVGGMCLQKVRTVIKTSSNTFGSTTGWHPRIERVHWTRKITNASLYLLCCRFALPFCETLQ
jgi:hypothetical protein